MANLAEFTRRTTISTLERVIEAASAAESCSDSNVIQRQCRFVNQALRKMQPLRVRNRKRGRTNVTCKQASEVPARYAESVCQFFDTSIVQRAIGD